MSDEPLKALSDIATEAHTRVQQQCADLNPVVSIRRGMRDSGIPADAMTLDCLASGKRIVLVLHDHQPGVLLYQFSLIDTEAAAQWEKMPLSELDCPTLVDWITGYFSTDPGQ